MLPFGIDLKSLLIGIIIAYFVIPFIRAKLAARAAPSGGS